MTSTEHSPATRLFVIGYLILALGVVLGLYGAYHATRKASHVSACVTEWANATSERSSLLSGLALARTTSLDHLIRDVANRSPSHFRRDLRRYIAASNAYNRGLEDHPPPAPPRIRC